jgi:hypothetical protein
VPADGTRLANCGKRKIRYVAVFRAALTLAKFLIYAASITATEQNCSLRNGGGKPTLLVTSGHDAVNEAEVTQSTAPVVLDGNDL